MSYILIILLLLLLFPIGSFSTTDQGTVRGTGVLRFSEMETGGGGGDAETAKHLYQKGRDFGCGL